MNPNICQFVAIRGIRGLCGIGVLSVIKINAELNFSFFINKTSPFLLKGCWVVLFLNFYSI